MKRSGSTDTLVSADLAFRKDGVAHACTRLGRAAGPPILRWAAHQHNWDRGTGSWTIDRWGWQFTGSEGLDEAYLPSFGAFGAAWDDAMVARWSANPLGMLWPGMDALLDIDPLRRPAEGTQERHHEVRD